MCIRDSHDAVQVVALGDQAAIAAGVAGLKAKHDNGVAGAGIEHGRQGFGADEGGVGVKHDRLARRSGQKRGCLGDGMGGAKLRVLNHHLAGLVKGLGGGRDLFCAMTLSLIHI